MCMARVSAFTAIEHRKPKKKIKTQKKEMQAMAFVARGIRYAVIQYANYIRPV